MHTFVRLCRNSSRFSINCPKKYKSTSASPDRAHFNYCADLVRKYDYENFLSSLVLPAEFRSTALAIRALNIEISKAQEHNAENLGGLTRLKFWDENLDLIYDNKEYPDHPVLHEIRKATKNYKMSKLFFKRLVSAREKQLNVSTFKDMEDMENYAHYTCSSVLLLLLEAMNAYSVDCDHVASHIGKAQGLTNLIRALPHNLKEKLVLLPRSQLVKHNISEESLMRNSVDPTALSDITYEIASKANNHLKVADSLKDTVPGKFRSVFLPAVPVRSYLEKLEKHKFFIYAPELNQKNGLLPLYMVAQYKNERFKQDQLILQFLANNVIYFFENLQLFGILIIFTNYSVSRKSLKIKNDEEL